MPREKNGAPGRLPTNGDVVALAAFEVRLAADSEQGELGPFGSMAHSGLALEDEDEDTSWLVADDYDERALTAEVDGAEAKEKAPNPFLRKSHHLPLNCILPGADDIAIRLAEIELDLNSNRSQVRMLVPSLSEYCDDSDRLRLRLERKSVGGCTELSLVLTPQSEDGTATVLFAGPAEYWLGASEKQLSALATQSALALCVPCRLEHREDERVMLCCSICAKNGQGKIFPDMLSSISYCTPDNMFYGPEYTRVVMEWLFPGSVTTNMAHARRYLALDDFSMVQWGGAKRVPVGPQSAHALFGRLRPAASNPLLPENLVPREMTCTLRPYQRRAIQWMVTRETMDARRAVDDLLSVFFCSYFGSDGKRFEFCPTNGTLVVPGGVKSERYSYGRDSTSYDEQPRGGILADEMGLGKTVEVLGLLLAHKVASPQPEQLDQYCNGVPEDALKKQDKDQVLCLCQEKEDNLPRGFIQCLLCSTWQHAMCSVVLDPASHQPAIAAQVEDLETVNHVCLRCRGNTVKSAPFAASTLIVCPTSILTQWEAEIARHTNPGSVKIFVYPGVRAISDQCGKAKAQLLRAKRQRTKLERKLGTEHPDVVAAAQAVQDAETAHCAAVRLLWPQHLCSFDVVLTTYAVLRQDLFHVDTQKRQRGDKRFSLRREKKYPAPPSPLGSIKWRRVCLDEAQMVESSTAAAAEMALSLRTQFRWAITGTPVGKHGLEDLYGLLLFVGAPALSHRGWWKRFALEPLAAGHRRSFARLVEYMRGIVWRNTKKDVRDELQLPGLIEHVHRVEFTPIERHFYAKQHSEVRALAARQGGGDTKVADLIAPLLRLRQACCHPQIGSFGIQGTSRGGTGGKRRRLQRADGDGDGDGKGTQKKAKKKGHSVAEPMSMAEVRDHLMSKAKVECEEAQRLLIMNLNAVAGLLLATDSPDKAKKQYMGILELVRNSKGTITTDSMQELHSLEGLCAVLRSEQAGELTKTLHLDRLETRVRKIREHLMARHEHAVSAAVLAYKGKAKPVAELSQPPRPIPGLVRSCDWWVLAAELIDEADPTRGEIIVQRMRMDRGSGGAVVDTRSAVGSRLVDQFRDLDGLRAVLARELGKIEQAHKELQQTVQAVAAVPSQGEMLESGECRTCRYYFKKTGPTCAHCVRRRSLTKMEALLFSFRDGGRKRPLDAQRDEEEADADPADYYSFRDPCETQLILGVLKQALKPLRGSALSRDQGGLVTTVDVLACADRHLELFAAMAAELAAAWAVWRYRDAQLKAGDEVAMATLRMRLVVPGEEVSEEDAQWKIHPAEAPLRLQEYELEAERARSQLRQCMSQMTYLKGLEAGRTVQGGVTSTQSGVECCPICHDPFGEKDKFSTLPCGHALCVDCVKRLARFSSCCPTCRARYKGDDVRYVSNTTTPSGSTPTSNASSASSSSSSNVTKSKQQQEQQQQQQLAARAAKGGLGSKLDAIVACIMRLEVEDPKSKILVFSNWEEMLNIMEHGMLKNDISYVRLRGRAKYDERLALFRRDPAVRVLLLPLKSGAKGLNLTEANHVIFTEPVANASVEAQAVGRIHRMGQTRRAHAHHFIVRGTVEERIHKLFRSKRLHEHAEPGADHVQEGGQEAFYDTRDVLATEAEALTEDDIHALFVN